MLRHLKTHSNDDISGQVENILALIDRTKVATVESEELQSHWARYLCIIASGLVENAVRTSYMEFVKKTSSAEVSKYVSANFERMRNPSAVELKNIAGQFNDNWKEELTKYLNEDGRGDALSSLINQRNLIAHGRSSDITIRSLQEYFKKVQEIIVFVDDQCLR